MAVRLPKAVTDLVAAFERLPGMGPKSATRLVFYLLNTPEEFVNNFARLLVDFKKNVSLCPRCFSVSDNGLCQVCRDETRDGSKICVVERAIDVMAIEGAGGFDGFYHVLGGVINPLERVGPDDIKIDELVARLRQMEGKNVEVILATNPTMEGEATALNIKKRLEEEKIEVNLSRIGSGLPMGADLGYADMATLSRALEGRRGL